MKLLTVDIVKKLNRNYIKNNPPKGEAGSHDLEPVVKFFDPFGAATWLITEMDNDGLCFGLCDLGQGFPELGYVHINDLGSLPNNRIERDAWFTADKTLSEYAKKARAESRINA